MFKQGGEWMSIDRTVLPTPPRQTTLTVRETTGQRFDVTFPVEAHLLKHGLAFLLWAVLMLPLLIGAVFLAAVFPRIELLWWLGLAFFIPMAITACIGRRFRRAEGGRLCLERSQLSAAGGAVVRWSRVYPIDGTSKLAVISSDTSDESTTWLLQLEDPEKKVALTDSNVLSVADMRWLAERFNEWLGWEFPAHCLECGRPLERADLNWPQRRVECSGCGFLGPAPDPFDAEAVPPPPDAVCPNCAEPIRLTQINRQSGGCHCPLCGWESEAAPSLRPRDFEGIADYCSTLVGRWAAAALQFPQHLVSGDELIDEFPTPESAWAKLANEDLIVHDQKGRLVAYRHWRTRGLPTVVAALAGGVLLAIILLATVLGGPAGDRGWMTFFAVWTCRFGLLVLGGTLLAATWWGCRRTVFLFSAQALAWECSGRRRVATWPTVGAVGVPRTGWPPLFVVKHGGAGILFAPPSKAAARALARLCLAYRDQALEVSGSSPTEPSRFSPIA
ncbi:MAG TPA: hypothetical protein VG125_19295 [Pirellulales bacterium]|jgi:hypothetical protein|nr:hypothetical protein [Pirellulales bacterium]